MAETSHIESLNRHYAGHIAVLKSDYVMCQKNFEKQNSIAERERLKVNQIKDLRDKTNEKLLEIQEEIDCDPLPEASQPLSRIQKRDIIQMQMSQHELAYQACQASFEAAMKAVSEAEKKMFTADSKLNEYLSSMDDPQLAFAIQLDLTKERAKRLQRLDEERLKKLESQRYAGDLIDELKQEQQKTNKALHQIATKRLQAALDVTKATKEGVDVYKNEYLATRKIAEAEFAADIAEVEALIATNAEKHVNRVNKARKRLEDEKEGMLKRGLNPYAEFRKQELDEEAKKREQKLKKHVDENQSKLAMMLIQEDNDRLRREAELQRIQNYEKNHRAEQGRHMIEAKNEKYIESVTLGNQSILDPTGRIPHVFPSKVVAIPDHSFGLGKSERVPDEIKTIIIDKMKSKHHVSSNDLGEFERIVNTMKSNVETLRSTQISGHSNNDSDDDDKALISTDINHSTEAYESLNLSGTQTKYPTAKLSKFEMDSLNRSRALHKERIIQGQTQVVNGRTYSGAGFAAKPSEICFQNFEVGKVYKKKIVLTNVSYSFNSFKILDFNDIEKELFSLLYDRPGRMTAGVSCSIEISFKPQLNQDIYTSIRMLCDTGPVEIPIRCLIKRCAPRVSDRSLDFGTIIIGQKMKKILKVVNTEAIGTDIFITRIENDSIDMYGSNESTNSNNLQNCDFDSEYDEKVEKLWLSQYQNNKSGLKKRNAEFIEFYAISLDQLNQRISRVKSKAFSQKLSKTPHAIYLSKSDLYINGYDSVNVEIIAEPLQPCQHSQDFLVTFPGVPESSDSSNFRQQIVSVKMEGSALPIEVITPVVDMKCCLYNRIYRQHCQLQNHGKIAYRVNVKVEDIFQPYLEIYPSTLIVQAHEISTFNIKFFPTEDILRSLSYYTLLNSSFSKTGLLSFPIQLEIQNQELPVYFTMRVNVTSSTLILSTPVLDFSDCYINQQVSQPIVITNTSILPQKIGFTKLRKEVSIYPNDGFATLLPNESITFDISLTPLSAIPYNFDLSLVTSNNDTFPIQIKANGVDVPIQVSTSVFHLRAANPGERVLESAFVKNISSSMHSVEISVPDRMLSWVRISPMILELEPGQQQRIEIEFSPPINCLSSILNPQEWYRSVLFDVLKHRGSSLKSSEKLSMDPKCILHTWEHTSLCTTGRGAYGEICWVKGTSFSSNDASALSPPASPSRNAISSPMINKNQSIIGRWEFPVFFRPLKQSVLALSNNNSQNETSQIFICLESLVVPSFIELSSKSINFENVIVGTSVTKVITIHNKGLKRMTLSCSQIDDIGPFTVLNALRPIEPGGYSEVVISCRPRPGCQPAGVINEALEFQCSEDGKDGGHKIQIQLKCQAIQPELELKGLATSTLCGWGTRGGILDFGNIVISDFFGMKFSVCNTKTEPKDVRINWTNGRSSSEGFSIKPDRFTVPGEGCQVVDVTFKPSSERIYRDEFDVSIYKEDCVRVGVFGRGWARQVIASADDLSDEPAAKVIYSKIKQSINALSIGGKRPKEKFNISSPQSRAPDQDRSTSFIFSFMDLFPGNGVDIDQSLFTTIVKDVSSRAQSRGKEKQSKQSKDVTPVIDFPSGSRQQTKKLILTSLKLYDGRKVKSPPSFEVILSPAAKANSFISVVPDKGPIANDGSVTVEFVYTQAPPMNEDEAVNGDECSVSSNTGSMSSQSESFEAEVVLRGGWVNQGDSNEKKISVVLKLPKVNRPSIV